MRIDRRTRPGLSGTVRSRAPLAIAAAVLMLLTLGGVAGAAPNPNADPNYPDLPAHKSAGFFYGTLTDTLAFASASQQYVRIADARVALDLQVIPRRTEPGEYSHLDYPTRAYAIDGAHDDPQSFGVFPDTRVRTVAFGSVPVEATIHISQLRDDEGLLVPLDVNGQIVRWRPGAGPRADTVTTRIYTVASDTTMAGLVEVRVSDVAVDGVPVDVGANCRPVAPARLEAVGEGYVDSDYDHDDNFPYSPAPPGKFNPALGGLLSGSIDIPAFSGCGTDDLGPLLTAMISGEQLPVKITTGSYNLTCFGDTPANNSLALCQKPGDELPIPARPE